MLSNTAVILSVALMNGEPNTLQVVSWPWLAWRTVRSPAILTLGGCYVLGMAFDITTTFAIARTWRARQTRRWRELLLKAPGTYHHSIMVGNMAEQAADAVCQRAPGTGGRFFT